GDGGDVRLRAPGREELRTEEQRNEHARLRDVIDQQTQELEGRRVGPVDVLKDDTSGVPLCRFQEPRDHGLKGLLLLPLWSHRKRRIAMTGGERQQGRKQRDSLRQLEAEVIQHAFQGREPSFSTVVALKLQKILKKTDYGIESAVLVIGRTAGFKISYSFAGGAFLQHAQQ